MGIARAVRPLRRAARAAHGRRRVDHHDGAVGARARGAGIRCRRRQQLLADLRRHAALAERLGTGTSGSFALREEVRSAAPAGWGCCGTRRSRSRTSPYACSSATCRRRAFRANSGVFVRFPDLRTPLEDRPEGSCGTVGAARTSSAWVAIYCGQEMQIYDGETGEPQKTGSIYNFDQPRRGPGRRDAEGRVERLRDPRGRPALHDRPQRRADQHVRQLARSGVVAPG